MQNKGKLITSIIIAYAVLSIVLVALNYSRFSPIVGFQGESVPASAFVSEMTQFQPTEVQAAMAESGEPAAEPNRCAILPMDDERLQDRFALPAIERMDPNERGELVERSQCVRRIYRLGVDIEQFQKPELAWKSLYRRVHQMARDVREGATEEAVYSGGSVSGLNELIAGLNGGKARVIIESATLEMDATLAMASGVWLEGNRVRLIPGKARLDKAVDLGDATDCGVIDIVIEGGCDCGIYAAGAKSFVLSGNAVSGASGWGVAMNGSARDFLILNNAITGNGAGGILLNGDLCNGLLESNTVCDNTGDGETCAGIGLYGASMLNAALDGWQSGAPGIADVAAVPRAIVLYDNKVRGNAGAGVASRAGYLNYFTGNELSWNGGEGLRLEYGAFGCYAANNVILRNGAKGSGRRDGVLLDNAAYNTLYCNVIMENCGSGIRCASTVHRSYILCNEIADNNRNGDARCFGIGFGEDIASSAYGREKDASACFENIVARNMISGGHYAAVYLGRESYINDFFDNTFVGCTQWSMECDSDKYNASVNNLSNVDSHGISLSGTVYVIPVAGRVD